MLILQLEQELIAKGELPARARQLALAQIREASR